jgi:uncharacterized protein (TIGR02145 family)
MAENLNVETEDSWCYDNKESNCEKYGRLYNWNAAKTACPAGWHLPSREEWQELFRAVDANTELTSGSGGWDYNEDNVVWKKLKSTYGWNKKGNGTDDFGFSALPGGGRLTDGNFYYAGHFGDWWTATERCSTCSNGSVSAYRWNMYYNYDYAREDYYGKSFGFSVRCRGD